MSGYHFKCKDIGMKDCDFEVKGSPSKEEVLQIAAVHAKQSHKMDPIPPEIAQKVSNAIKS
jgi:predicted small metal-binding protein